VPFARRPGSWRCGTIIAVGLLTALALILRLADVGQSLYGDERYTYAVVDRSFGAVWHQVYTTSITPPLDYWLAWLALRLGHAPSLIRLPSLLAGTALVPLLFLLGRRVGGAAAGLVAAGIIALSPFAIFYSTEGRAYEVMVFLVALSTYALLQATAGRGRRWWVVYAFAACGAMWSHYTALFVLVVQAAWSLWARPGHRRALVAASVAAAIGWLPWIPGYLTQRLSTGPGSLAVFGHTTVTTVLTYPIRVVAGHPFLGLSTVPGAAGLALAAALVVLGASALARATAPVGMRSLRSERFLLVLLAAATPAGLLLSGLVGPDLYGLRDISASQPALVLVIALVVVAGARARRAVGVPALAALAVGLIVVGARATTAAEQRPAYDDVARYLDAVADSAPILDTPLPVSPDARLGQSTLELYLRRPHAVYLSADAAAAAAAWHREARDGLFLVSYENPALIRALGLDRAPVAVRERMRRVGGPDGRAIARQRRTFPGLYPLTVTRYEGRIQGRLRRSRGAEVLDWTLGHHVVLRRGLVSGAVEHVTATGRAVAVTGWAVARASPARPVDWLLLFVRRHLLGVSPGGHERPGVAARLGAAARQSGFGFLHPERIPDPGAIRVFAVVGNRAEALPRTEAPP
jgi:hypothetical protein